MKILLPFSIQFLPSFLASALSAAASDPAADSVRTNEPVIACPEQSRGKYLLFCSLVPNFSTTSATMLVTDIATAVEAQTFETSIRANA